MHAYIHVLSYLCMNVCMYVVGIYVCLCMYVTYLCISADFVNGR